MVPLLLLSGVLAGLSTGIPMMPTGMELPADECCESKDVGGVGYSLVGRMNTKDYNCLNDCIYVQDEEPSVKFCFASGDLEVECTEDETYEGTKSPPMEGSEMPPMEGSEMPPMEGSEMPPMEGSEMPPMEGSEMPPMEGSEMPPLEGSEMPSMEGSERPPIEGTVQPGGCKCGVKKGSRIVGGTETEVNEYPWMAGIADISDDSSFYCGGTLIASQWVVTASHCLFKNSDGTEPTLAIEVQIVLGEHDLSSTTESIIPRKKVTVSQIVTHPSYNALSSSNDIALLKLSEEVDLNVYTPSCVANTGDNFDGKNAWVYGWGTTSFGGVTPNKLLEVEVPIVTNTVCDAAMGEITADKLCAGGELNKDGCQGDSGGPLTVDVSGKHVLVGDVSYGNGCGLAGQYGVYGNVAYLRAWIDTTVAANGGAKYCPS